MQIKYNSLQFASLMTAWNLVLLTFSMRSKDKLEINLSNSLKLGVNMQSFVNQPSLDLAY